MTIRLSPQKMAKIMRCYFNGMAQTEIAKKAGVDQSTVSLYASRFRDTAGEIGLLAAGKEFMVFNEVNALRSLAVELSKANITVEEAKQGHNIVRAFLKLGVRAEQHTSLVKVCREVSDPGFVQAAIRLSKIEAESNMSYETIVARLEQAASQLLLKEKLLNETKTDLAHTEKCLGDKKQEFAELGAKLGELRKAIEAEEAELEQKIEANKRKLKLKQAEMEEFARLKAELNKRGWT
jgi:predicted transcriptional regulator